MKVTITVGWWDENTSDGWVRHHKGEEVDLPTEDGEWLVKCGAATALGDASDPSPEQSPSKSRRRQSASK